MSVMSGPDLKRRMMDKVTEMFAVILAHVMALQTLLMQIQISPSLKEKPKGRNIRRMIVASINGIRDELDRLEDAL